MDPRHTPRSIERAQEVRLDLQTRRADSNRDEMERQVLRLSSSCCVKTILRPVSVPDLHSRNL